MARDLHQIDAAGDTDDPPAEPPQIRRFRLLVSLLMVVMMVGILAIAGALVWKLSQPGSAVGPSDALADITLPADTVVLGVSTSGTRLFLILEVRETGTRILEERRASDRSLIRRDILKSSE